MFRTFLLFLICMCAISCAFSQLNDSQLAQLDQVRMLWETDFIEAALSGDTSYTVVLQQSMSENETVTSRAPCTGIIMDAETIVTSAACRVALTEEKTNSSYQIMRNPQRTLLTTQVLKVKPPMILRSNFIRPPFIDNTQEYEKYKNLDVFGIAIATQGSKLGLVRWYDQMTPGTGRKSVCEEKYSALQQQHSGWPESLPQGIFCIRGGNQREDKYVTTIKGRNVTVESGLPCEDSVGSPILIPNQGLFGIVTTALCESDSQVAFAQSLAYVHLPEDEPKNRKTAEPDGSNKTTVFSKIGKPPAFYPKPEQYLGPPYIKVIEPTPSSTNRISSFVSAWTAWNIVVLVGYSGLNDSVDEAYA